jgi:predicted ribosomally synthesized peptide with nif11-like leader
MKNSTSLDAFVEKIKSDPALRSKIEEAEKSAMADFEKIKKIAKDAGHDIALDTARPDQVSYKPTDQEVENLRCMLTCCWIETSVWDTEGPSIGGF